MILVMAVKLGKFSDNNSYKTGTSPSPTQTLKPGTSPYPTQTLPPVPSPPDIVGLWKITNLESNVGGFVFPCTAFKFSDNEEVTCYLLSPLVPPPKTYGKYTIDNQNINISLKLSDEIPEASRLLSNIDGEYKINISGNTMTLSNEEITIFLEKPGTTEPSPTLTNPPNPPNNTTEPGSTNDTVQGTVFIEGSNVYLRSNFDIQNRKGALEYAI